MDTNRPDFSILDAVKTERILAEAFETLDKVGVFIENDQGIELLAGAGARVTDDRKRVFIPQSLCETCIATVPGSFMLYDREGEEVGPVGEGNVIFDPGSAAISVYDFKERRIRKPLTKDVVDLARLTDRLHAFEAQSTAVVPSDVPEQLADRYRLLLALVCGKKPVITGTFTKEAFPTMLSFLVAVRGNERSLREKPLAIFDCCPSPPLMWSDLTCQALIDCARHGVPAEIVSMPLAGATAPVTLAGSLVQHTAETLSGIVIHQTVNPGAPLVYGGAAACFDMRNGTTPMGAVETMLIDASYVQIARKLGMPAHVYMGLSDAKSPDFQAGFETAMGVTLAALAGANVVSGPGMLNFVSCQSLEKLVLDNEICAMAKRLLAGVEFREKSVGFEVLSGLGEHQSFLTSDHTRRFFRDEVYYPSNVVDRSTQSAWEKNGSLSAAERAHKKVNELLCDKTDHTLGQGTVDQLASIMERDATRHGDNRLPDWRAMLG
ncbi:MAG: trimethylamine methyltransferase family protein [Candidatus Krumholzibacteria bacterium]|nr:trimethylamine methyltransferase family protein [Candidatus Krumholzibacteria bacterium]